MKSAKAVCFVESTVLSSGFVQALESPVIKTLRFSGLESHEMKKSWNSKEVVLEMLFSGISVAN